MNLVDHARRELELIGEDQDVADWMVSVVAKFAEIGHSGGSLDICVDRVTSLLRRENLSPLTDDPADWTDRSPESGYPIWQSVRNPKAFSRDGGETYWTLSEGSGTDDAVTPTYRTMAKVR